MLKTYADAPTTPCTKPVTGRHLFSWFVAHLYAGYKQFAYILKSVFGWCFQKVHSITGCTLDLIPMLL